WNTGDRNTGYWNTGDRNTGYWNTGDCNTGDWNTTNFSNGFFNTEEVEIINVFDKPCMKSVWDEANKPSCLYFSLTKWIYESAMSDVEKQENPSFSCTGGYLKKYDYKEAFTKSVTEASKEDRDLIRALPNFNNEKFLEISGVDLSQLD
ncbi:pentapeptide repeat-containing protein, partial [Acinetobacter sp. CFCC 10889]|uniref:pentapeptide repeat-containing protein n=1 Tax=Acinetobacter sp. CFCC 10889 TaxID=1775557 RepID=UPI001BC897CB